MAYFIFLKNFDNIEGSLYQLAENQSDFDYLNLPQQDYKIIEDDQNNFNDVKFSNKLVLKYAGETIIYKNNVPIIKNKNSLESSIKFFNQKIQEFLQNNPNHLLFNRWNDYYNQLNNLNVDSITYPLNKSLEQYFNDLGQPSFHILQLP